ncbi:hypothetical protein FWF48_02735 [Candidatus Saccharibacteria bacterium]|nr:hypothetical protein [Candidatus Saccharibacteria bacterium]
MTNPEKIPFMAKAAQKLEGKAAEYDQQLSRYHDEICEAGPYGITPEDSKLRLVYPDVALKLKKGSVERMARVAEKIAIARGSEK